MWMNYHSSSSWVHVCDEIYRIGKAGLKTLSGYDYVAVRNRFAIIGPLAASPKLY